MSEDSAVRAYHVTPRRNLLAILSEGLVPSIGPRSSEIGETTPLVFLFRDDVSMTDAVMNWLGDQFPDDEDLVALVVDVSGMQVRDDPDSFEITVDTHITAERITESAIRL